MPRGIPRGWSRGYLQCRGVTALCPSPQWLQAALPHKQGSLHALGQWRRLHPAPRCLHSSSETCGCWLCAPGNSETPALPNSGSALLSSQAGPGCNGSLLLILLGRRSQWQLRDRVGVQRFRPGAAPESPLHLSQRSRGDAGR